MPNIKSAEKRVEISKKQNLTNRSTVSELNTYTKKFKNALATGNIAEAETLLNVVFSKLDGASATNSIHQNNAARKKAHLSKLLSDAKKA